VIVVEIAGMGRGGRQVFRAESESEMIAKLREAQRHATRKIRELSTLVKILMTLLMQCGKSGNWIQTRVQRHLAEMHED
jgi:hypothetical protein